MDAIDPTAAGAIAALTEIARKRLDGYVRLARADRKEASRGFRADAAEMPALKGVQGIGVIVRRDKPIVTIRFDDGVIWEQHKLTLRMEAPDTVLSAMRDKPLPHLVSHPLLEGAVISSARMNEDVLVIETKRRTGIELADIESTGITVPLVLDETFDALGVRQVCRVAAKLVAQLSASSLQTLLERLAGPSRHASLDDLLRWMPAGIETISVDIKDDALLCRAALVNGTFRTGTLSVWGGARSRSQILGGSVFASYKGYGPSYQPRKPKAPLITVEEFRSRMASR